MRNLDPEVYFIAAMVIILSFTCFITKGFADTVNPCEYLNIEADKMQHMDTGNDPNFTRIVQQNNQEMIRNCQQYEIKKYRVKTEDADVPAPVYYWR